MSIMIKKVEISIKEKKITHIHLAPVLLSLTHQEEILFREWPWSKEKGGKEITEWCFIANNLGLLLLHLNVLPS